MSIRETLFSLRDEKFAAFQARLIPNVAPERIIGVRTPALRKLAKTLRGSGEAEEFLKVAVEMDEDKAKAALGARVITNKKSPVTERLTAIVADAYDRLLFPSPEREIRNDLFDTACEGALVVFSDNLRHLLMVAPIKGKTVLGYDPGFRTGCKLAVVDKTGQVLDTAAI